MSWKTTMFVGALAATLTVGCAKKQEEVAPPPEPAAAPAPMMQMMLALDTELHGAEGSGVTGKVSFTQENDGPLKIVAEVSGVTPGGQHGFHIHETGDCSAPDFTSAGGHFNPTDTVHGSPTDADHHAGDLGNIEIGEDGTGRLEISSDKLSLGPGPNSILDRAIILHEKADDMVSQPTGDAGGRIACGVIELGGEPEMVIEGGPAPDGEGAH